MQNKKDEPMTRAQEELSSHHIFSPQESFYNKEKNNFVAGFSEGASFYRSVSLKVKKKNFFMSIGEKIVNFLSFGNHRPSSYEGTYEIYRSAASQKSSSVPLNNSMGINKKSCTLFSKTLPFPGKPLFSYKTRTYEAMDYPLFLPWEKGFFLLSPDGFLTAHHFSGRILWYVFLNDLSFCSKSHTSSSFLSWNKKYKPCKEQGCLKGFGASCDDGSCFQKSKENKIQQPTQGVQKYCPQKEYFATGGKILRFWKRFSNNKIDDGPGLFLELGRSRGKNILYVLTGQGILKAFVAETGEKLWDTLPYTQPSLKGKEKSPWNGFLQSRVGLVQFHGDLYLCALSPKGEIVFLDGLTGKLLWTHETLKEGAVLQNRAAPLGFSYNPSSLAPSITQDSSGFSKFSPKSNKQCSEGILVTDFSGMLHGFNERGDILWTTSLVDRSKSPYGYHHPHCFISKPFVDGQKTPLVLSLSSNGQISAVDLRNGHIAWHRDGDSFYLPPLIKGNFCYFLSSQGLLTCFEKNNTPESLQWSVQLDPSLSWMGFYSLDLLDQDSSDCGGSYKSTALHRDKKKKIFSFLKTKNNKKLQQEGKEKLGKILSSSSFSSGLEGQEGFLLASRSGDLFFLSFYKGQPLLCTLGLKNPLACPPVVFQGKLHCLTVKGEIFALSRQNLKEFLIH